MANRHGMRAAAVAAVLTALLFVGNALGADSPKKDEVARCHNARATIVGTDQADKLRGTPSRDVIMGSLGDDEIVGSLGNDIICGGPGADLIHGGRGNDIVDGGAGEFDIVIGDLGDDHVLGGPGNGDEAAGSLGIDTVSGGAGDMDLVHGDYGYDRMDGGAGAGDIASFATDVGAGKSGGVKVSLARHRARGDGHDRLFRLESIEGSAFDDILVGSKQANIIDGGPGKDVLRGGGGADTLNGDEGPDKCQGAKGRTSSCGHERRPKASGYVEVDATPGGGGGLAVVGRGGPDHFIVAYDPDAEVFGVSARKGIAIGPGCSRPEGSPTQVVCALGGPARWLMADLGPGNDSLAIEGSLAAVGFVRLAGGLGNDTIKGGPEDDLIEAGFGADKLYGGAGSDGLIGSTPGPTFLYGGADGDLLAAGGGCAGGAIVGGTGKDDASFAETQAHPGLLYVSFPKNRAWIDEVRGCNTVRLDSSNEDMEGSFDNDVLIGDGGKNAILGQPGEDRIYGGGGEDVLDARDGVRDAAVQCARGPQIVSGAHLRPGAFASSSGWRAGRRGHAFIDPFDPHPVSCGETTIGHPVKGLGKTQDHQPGR
jgi:Ca2+-binding RTX toxin-like protein